jgi:hypothetical protein
LRLVANAGNKHRLPECVEHRISDFRRLVLKLLNELVADRAVALGAGV